MAAVMAKVTVEFLRGYDKTDPAIGPFAMLVIEDGAQKHVIKPLWRDGDMEDMAAQVAAASYAVGRGNSDG